ncbi:MAG: phytoene desaturase family protein [Thermomicrobiales bacterium]
MHVVVIGAGMGGLAAAVRLAVRGIAVTVCEQGPRPGGKMNQWASDGWAFDTGPSLLTMPWVLRDLFADAGCRLDDLLTLDPVDPICRYTFPDGSSLDVTTDSARMAANIEALSPRDVPAYFRFLAYTSALYATAAEPFLRYPMRAGILARERHDLFRLGFRPRDLAKVASFRSVHGTVQRFFRDPRLQRVFDRYATYNGSSPYHAPAALSLISFAEFSTGAWYPRGGMYRIAEALTTLTERLGVTMHLNAPVAAITHRRGSATGVRLIDGDHVAADAVISNVDVRTTYERLLDSDLPGVRTMRAALCKREPSYSAFLLLLGTRRTFPELPHHSLLFSENYRAEFADIIERHVPPTDPTIYLCRATATDPSVAPPGCDNLFVMVNVPFLDGRTDWQTFAPRYRDRILDALRRRGLEIAPAIAVEAIWTPETIAQAYGAQRGAIYGFASNGRGAAFLRPPNQSPILRGLFFAGGSTHPGGGVPLALLSGKIAADLVFEKEKERAA